MDLSFFEPGQALLREHQHWLGPAIALVAFSESLAGLGLLLPGIAMLFALGVLAGSGMIEPLPMLLWASGGAALGDGVSFFIGYRFHYRVKGCWPFVRHPDWLEKGEAFFHRYGVLSIVLGRFIGPIRPVLPLVAGMLDMPPRRFYPVNLLLAFPWAIVYLMPGFMTGAALDMSDQLPREVFLLAGALLLGGLFLALSGLRLDRYLSKNYSPALAPALLLIFSGGTLALLLTMEVSGLWQNINDGVQVFIQGLATPLVRGFFSAVTWLGSLYVLWLFFAIVLIRLWLQDSSWRKVYLVLASLCGMEAMLWLLKWSFDSPRPSELQGLDPFSFPSGHTTQAAYFLLLFAFTTFSKLKPFLRVLAYGMTLTLIFLVALSRLVLNLHWFGEVAAGFMLGSFWAAMVLCGDRYLKAKYRSV